MSASLGDLVQKALDQIEDAMDDPEMKLKDRISIWRCIAYLKGTSSQVPSDGKDAAKMLRDVKKLPQRRSA